LSFDYLATSHAGKSEGYLVVEFQIFTLLSETLFLVFLYVPFWLSDQEEEAISALGSKRVHQRKKRDDYGGGSRGVPHRSNFSKHDSGHRDL
jgi:hypothetical protein